MIDSRGEQGARGAQHVDVLKSVNVCAARGDGRAPRESISTRRLPAVRAGSLLAAACAAILVSGCAKDETTGSTCETLSGSAWSPNVSAIASANHDSSVQISKSAVTGTGKLTGVSQAASSSQEISVTIPMKDDLGVGGSLALVAETTDFPANLKGWAYPFLVYLSDGTSDLINLARAGSTGDCAATGYFTCTNSVCTESSGCVINSPSAYANRTEWQQHQLATFGYTSVNVFPTCNWSSGSPSCAFNSNFFSSGKLRSGVDYVAKYVLLADSYDTLSNYSAGVKVTVIKKTDATSSAGAIDVNAIIVGTDNIKASRTANGKRNLDALFANVAGHFSQSDTSIKIGKVTPVEWTCDNGGDAYATLKLTDLSTMLQSSTKILPTTTEGKALNVFIVSLITSSDSSSSLKILGVSGGIGGPMIDGTASSGLVFASDSKLESYNPGCGTDCPESSQEAAFREFSITTSHEMGHYLGLNHLSESAGTVHDALPDTPYCTNTQLYKGKSYITISACKDDANGFASTGKSCKDVCSSYDGKSVFCPDAKECEFNYMMWWTSKNYSESLKTGDANYFSPNSAAILNYSPYVQ